MRSFIDGLVDRNCEFSVGGRVCASLDAAIAAVAPDAWVAARDANGTPRRGAQMAELDITLDHWPSGTRAICRREKPHPGGQLRLWDHDGLRHQVVLTNSEGDRLLHTAGRLVHRSRQVLLRLPEHWPWADELAHAYQRLGRLTI